MPLKLKNFSLGHFNNDVNSSTDPDEKYERWTSYRKKISDFVSEAVKNNGSVESMIVFGAGALNDIDLNYLCNVFGKIVLTDVDEKSMLDGLARQKLSSEQKSKINPVQIDYSGAEEIGFFKKLEALAAQSAPVSDIIQYIEDTMLKLCKTTEKLKGLDKFDVVLSCPVYTQIVFTQIETFLRVIYDCGLYEYEEVNSILNAAYQSMPVLLNNYNDMVLSCVKEEGLLVMITDIVEIKKVDNKLEEIKRVLNKQDCNFSLIGKFIQENGLELALKGIDNLMSKIKIYDSFYTLWPFDDEKEYLSFLAAGKKTVI